MKNRKLLLVCVLLLVFSWTNSSGAPITVMVEDVTGNPGEKVTVQVFMELQPEADLGLAGMDIKIDIDTCVVKVDPGTIIVPGIRILSPTFGNFSTNVPETRINIISLQNNGNAVGFADLELPNLAAVAEFDLNVVGNPGDISPLTIDVGASGLSVGDGETINRFASIDVANNGSLSIPLLSPVVTSVNPSSGPALGGASVTLVGSRFQSRATVTFGDSTATDVVVLSSNSITATTPAHAADIVDVAVINPDGQKGTLFNGFTFSFVGDFNGDNEVDLSDFVLFLAVFGTTTGSDNWDSAYDLDGNGEIGLSDFVIFLDNFGRTG